MQWNTLLYIEAGNRNQSSFKNASQMSPTWELFLNTEHVYTKIVMPVK